MLRRTGFARPVYNPAPPAPPTRATRTAVLASYGAAAQPIEKEEAVRSEAYRRLVALLPCKHCGIAGYSQCAHGNFGKGGALKTDDRYTFPLCTVHPDAAGDLIRGCHERFDQGGLFSKAVRREIEPVWAADTRRHITAAGMWPADLPLWSEE